jgi:hypothetical protein
MFVSLVETTRMSDVAEEEDDWLNGKRSKKTGRFVKGRSGNTSGRPKKEKGETLPYELAQEILSAGAMEFEIVDKKTGKKQKLTALQVMLRQLAAAGANGDKTAAKQFVGYLNNASRTIDAQKQRQFERLGAYLKSLDDGKPWPLDEAEAAFYQRLAAEAGLTVKIQAHRAKQEVETLTAEELDLIVAKANLDLVVGLTSAVSASTIAEMARKIIYAERARQIERGR